MKIKSKLMKVLICIFGVLILIAAGTLGMNKISESKNAKVLKNKVIPLKTVKAESGFEDLKPLENILKDKKIVSVGEGTHGTKEFFQMKHRMFEFLVTKMGYRLFAIEAGFGDAQVVNDYILYGKGNVNDAVKALKYWTWKTEEVSSMMEWMRNYNRNDNNKTKIKFYGFDVQSTKIEKEKVLNYLKVVDSNSINKYESVFSKFNDDDISSLGKDKLAGIKNDINELLSNFDKNKEQYISKSSNSEYKMVYQDLNNIYKCLQVKSQSGMNYTNTRDKYMAENVKWILDYEKQFGNDKIMLWAHNGHVTKEMPNYTSMGAHLKKMFSNDMYVIGMEFYKGSFRAYPITSSKSAHIKEFTIKNSSFFTFAHNLHNLNIPLYFMDFNSAAQDKGIKQWLSNLKLIHAIGAEYSKYNPIGSYAPQIPLNSYDGMIFIDNISQSKAIN